MPVTKLYCFVTFYYTHRVMSALNMDGSPYLEQVRTVNMSISQNLFVSVTFK